MKDRKSNFKAGFLITGLVLVLMMSVCLISCTKQPSKADEKQNTDLKQVSDFWKDKPLHTDINDFVIENGVLKKYKGNAEIIVIPDSVSVIDEFAFTTRGNKEHTFKGNKSIKCIYVTGSVRRSGNNSGFAFCYNLKTINIAGSVEHFDRTLLYAFNSLAEINVEKNNKYYASKDGVLYNKDMTRLIEYPKSKGDTFFSIPKSVKHIGGYAFSNCDNLVSVYIPDSVESMETLSFAHNKNLKSINIPPLVTSIESTFARCESLESLHIPASVKNIKNRSFDECKSLFQITVDKDNKYFAAKEGVLYSKDMKRLIKYPEAKADVSFSVPNTVKDIDERAFSCSKSLTSINIPDSVANIGDGAFSECKYLTSVSISGSIASIGDGAFSSCNNLTEVNIKGQAVTIGKYGFLNCSNLVSASLLGVINIGEGAFSDCENVKSITISRSTGKIGENAFSRCDNLTIKTPVNSYAYNYAKKNKIKVEVTK